MTDTPQTLQKDIENQFNKLYDFSNKFTVTLLKYSENIIYKISFENAEAVVLRIHRPGYHTFDELESELIWMNEICSETDLHLPKAFKGRNGKVLQEIISSSGKKYFVSLISFLYGKAVGELKGNELIKSMKEIGEMTAKLHLQSVSRNDRPKLKRPCWDTNEFFGENAVWGHWYNYKGLSENDIKLFNDCQNKIITSLDKYGRTSEHYGLIHADLHFFNIISDGKKSQIIDFDDCGYGFYLYDLGCTLVTYSENLDELTKAWLEGYEKIRTLENSDKDMIPAFILLRRIIRLAWLSTHSDSDTAKTVGPEYLETTKDLAKKYIGI